MKLTFNDNTEIEIRKFTREYAQNQTGKIYLNITSNYESSNVFDDIMATAKNPENIAHMVITDDAGLTITFDGFKLDNVIEIHDGLSNDVTIRAYMSDQNIMPHETVSESASESESESETSSESLT